MFRILVAEDDKNLRSILISTLKKEGYSVAGAEDGRAALDIFCGSKFDMVITDVMMPVMDGNGFTVKLKDISPETPVLMLTALETLDDKERGFAAGADDYLTKPFALKELLLRCKALLRRYGKVNENKIVLPHAELNYSTFTVKVNGEEIELKKKEFLLLFKLLSSPGVLFTREQLMDEIWGYESESTDRTVDVHINRLRDKAECDDFRIITVRGIGYKAVIK